jgi:ribosomal protein S18 acetylase RimI-like enzyme
MTTTPFLPVRLRESDRAALETHFLTLGSEDRRLRFGASMSDDGVRAYVGRLDFERDGLFAVHDDELKLLAVVHVAVGGGEAEMGLSVLPSHREQGLGNALFTRAVVYLRNRGEPKVFVHCISENAAMMHLARKHGMRIVNEGAETDAHLVLEPATPQSILNEWVQDSSANAAQRVRRSTRLTRELLTLFAPRRSARGL